MEQYEPEPFNENHTEEKHARVKRQAVAGLVALLGIAGIAMSYGVHEHNQVQELTQQATAAKTNTDQLQAQVNALNARLNDMTSVPSTQAAPVTVAKTATDDTADTPAPDIATPSNTAPSAPIASTAKPKPPKQANVKHRPSASEKRYAELKAQLDDQQKQLKETADEVAKNRADLEGSISSTKDELNGSIARTHDELVMLEKRGERSYFEFDLDKKTKTFQRVGPITLSLRKTDTKHKSYDIAMLVDDNELSKKKVNLYEPVWIHTESGGEAVQIVVNRIDKDTVHGYVSAPKYTRSELATLSSPTSASPDSQPTQQTPQH
jgi:uncharacterized coiled-coil protein SlyX